MCDFHSLKDFFSFPLLSGRDELVEAKASKEIVEELKEQWRKLWGKRIDDKVRAEGIANEDFSKLFVDKGTVIFATRSFKMLSFREILELHKLVDIDRFVPPNPQVGGWGKFIRTVIANQKSSSRVRQARQYLDEKKQKKQKQQLKKGGRGWLHL
jgi:hypothetical protein